MGLRNAPTLIPAAGVLLGTALACRLSYLPVVGLVALMALGLIYGRTWGRWLFWLGIGLLNAAVFWLLPRNSQEPWVLERPVRAVVRLTAHWRPVEEGWTVAARPLWIRQGRRVCLGVGDELVIWLPGTDPPPQGEVLRLTGYLRRTSGFRNPGAHPPGPWRLRLKSRRFLTTTSHGPPWERLSLELRRLLERRLEEAPAESPGAALVGALVLGDRSRLPEHWRRGLRRWGLAHLLAVSGLHVGLVVGILLLVGRPLPPPARVVLTLAGVGVYLLLVGPRPSLLRASLMAACLLVAQLLERPPHWLNTLSLVTALLVLHRPSLIEDLGFQLTVAATAGILTLAPLLVRRFSPDDTAGPWPHKPPHRGLPPWLARPLAVSVSAQLFVLPWSLPRFLFLTPLSPLLNLVAVPWTALGLALAFLWSAAALLLPPSVAGSLWVFLDLWAQPFSWPALIPPSSWLSLPFSLNFGESLLLAVGLALVLALPPTWPRRRPWIWRCLGLGLVWLYLGLGEKRSGPLEVVMFDVGQGDAVALRDGSSTLLVDGGGFRGFDFAASVLLPALVEQGIRRLDAVVMTHPDLDHCGGLADLLGYLPVGEIWTAPGWQRQGCVQRLLDGGQAHVRILWQGEEARLGRWRLQALHPPPGQRRGRNERSLVLLATAAGRRLLLTGDIDARTEARILERSPGRLTCDVLKVAHHGSKGSTGGRFLAAARPRLALISAGRSNPYGHPSASVLERLGRRGIWVLRTDRHGRIRLTFDRSGPLRVSVGALIPTR